MSNIVADIYGTVKDGKSCMILNSNIVDISGNLTSKGRIQFFQSNTDAVEGDPGGILNRFNTVVNIPATDSDGNDLSANTTYEITTGPTGSINNISFVKKREPYYLSANKNQSQNLTTTNTDVSDWTVLAATDASDFNATTGIWTCPSTGVYTVNYELLVEGGFQILRIEAYIVVVGNSGSNTVRDARVDVGNGQADDFKFMPLKVSAMRELTAGMQVKVRMNATVAASVWHRINGGYATHMWIQRVD